jgi:hypothetical protein
MLFEPDAHERLTEDRWEPGRVHAAIREIVEDAERAFDYGWPNHPQDSDEERRFSHGLHGRSGENPNLTQEQYDAGRAATGASEDNIPDGALIHIAGPSPNGGWRVVEVWESEEQAQAWDDKINPILAHATDDFLDRPRTRLAW